MSTRREHFTKFDAVEEQVNEGFTALIIANGGTVTVGDGTGITGEFEGTFKKVKIVNGIITEFELE